MARTEHKVLGAFWFHWPDTARCHLWEESKAGQVQDWSTSLDHKEDRVAATPFQAPSVRYTWNHARILLRDGSDDPDKSHGPWNICWAAEQTLLYEVLFVVWNRCMLSNQKEVYFCSPSSSLTAEPLCDVPSLCSIRLLFQAVIPEMKSRFLTPFLASILWVP